MRFATLKRPAEFKRVRGGVRWASPLFIIEGKARAVGPAKTTEVPQTAAGPRFGFTITRKVGGAVVRNLIRRRLKEALRGLEARSARADYDYVVVASRASHDYPFAELQDALRAALQRLDRQAQSGSAAGGGKAKRGAGNEAARAPARVEPAASRARPAAEAPVASVTNDASEPIRPDGGKSR